VTTSPAQSSSAQSSSAPSPFNLDPQDKLSLGENIAQHIQGLLHQGKLRPGDTLPTQRELAQQYGTGVAAVREAISILSAAGVVDARPGRGTLILEAAEQLPSVNLWLGAVTTEQEALDFLDTRQTLEHYTIARAALNASAEDQAELRRVLSQMRDAGGDPELFVAADLALHFAIARAAGNPVMVRLLHAIHAPISQVLRVVSHQLIAEGRFGELYVIHEALVGAIVERDVDGALAAFGAMMNTFVHGETLGLALGRAAPRDEPLGEAFSEDLHWNLTRLIGPMAQVLIPEAAGQLGCAPTTLTARDLGAYLSAVGRQLPSGKQSEWQALSDLLQARYGRVEVD
jgi:GntR family transcriptional regulator, transcriptional repressor for pyruvate dehydrogenase complex